MRSVALYEMLFALLTIVGGIIGFVAAESYVSLVAGAIAGLILFFAALSMQKGSRRAMFIILFVTLVLLGYFGYSFFAGPGKFMPAGLMSILSFISLILLLILFVQPKERKRIF